MDFNSFLKELQVSLHQALRRAWRQTHTYITQTSLKILHFIFRERKQHFHILVLSDNQKKPTRTLSISYSLIALVIITISASLFGSIYFHRTYQSKQTLIEAAHSNQEHYTQELSALSQKTQEFNTHQQAYRKQINDIFEFLGDYSSEQIWNTSRLDTPQQEPPNDIFAKFFPDTNYQTAQNILYELQSNQIIAEHNYQHLTNLKNYLALKQELSATVPNGWPLENNNGYKTSSFGPRFSPFEEKTEFHAGVDIAAAPDSKVLAVADGRVETSEERSGFGKIVILRHAYGYKTLYAHNKAILVAPGATVKRGQPIAQVGNTGRSTGFHLHFEIRIGKKPVDPWPYIVKNF